MKPYFLFVLFILIFPKLVAQKIYENYSIGIVNDIMHEFYEGYFDDNVKPYMTIGLDEGGYLPGHYYDLFGRKVIGYLKNVQSRREFRFKKTLDGSSVTLVSDECKGLVILKDSFLVAKTHPERPARFLRYYGAISEYSYFHENDSVISQIPTKSLGIVGLLLATLESEPTFYRTLTGGAVSLAEVNKQFLFDEMIKACFPSSYDEKDENKLFKEWNHSISNILNVWFLIDKAQNQNRIYRNSSWGQVKNTFNYLYYGVITDYNKAYIHVKFYHKEGIPVYEGDYTYAWERLNQFKWYYPDGTVKKVISYNDRTPSELEEMVKANDTKTMLKLIKKAGKHIITKAYHPNGSLRYTYNNESLEFQEVFHSRGVSLLRGPRKSGVERVFDSLNSRLVTIEYMDGKRQKAYYDYGGKRIIIQDEMNVLSTLSGSLFRTGLIEYIRENLECPMAPIIAGNEGTILLRFIITSHGAMTGVEVIKGINDEIDQAIKDAFIGWIIKRGNLENVGLENEMEMREVVIPIAFNPKYEPEQLSPGMYHQYHQYHHYQHINTDNIKVPNGF